MPRRKGLLLETRPEKRRKPGRWERVQKFVRERMLTFLGLHYAVLCGYALFGAALVALIERGHSNTPFIDALFNCASAVACCGLATADVSSWRTGSLVVAIVVCELGSPLLSTCLAVSGMRSRRAAAIVARRRRTYQPAAINDFGSADHAVVDILDDNFEVSESPPPPPPPSRSQSPAPPRIVVSSPQPIYAPSCERVALLSATPGTSYGALPRATPSALRTPPLIDRSPSTSALVVRRTSTATLGGGGSGGDAAPSSSAAVVLPQHLQDKFMGLEFDYDMEARACKHLFIITLLYSIVVQLVATFVLVIYATKNARVREQIELHGSNKWFWSMFSVMSCFNNLGFTYWPDGISSIADDTGICIIVCLLVIMGNTCHPIFIRFTVWMTRNLSRQRRLEKDQQSLRYILKNSMRLSTHLFNSEFTLVLLLVNAVLWGSVTIAYVAHTHDWASRFSWRRGILVAVCSRAVGIYIEDMSLLPPSLLVIIIGSMYISVYPIAMIRHQTKAVLKAKERKKPLSKTAVLVKFWKSAVLNNVAWLYFVIFMLCALEIREGRPQAMSVMAILFEVASAYGDIGYSFGWPGTPTSLTGAMCPFSKLLIMCTIILGRHRGLPHHVYHKDMREGVAHKVNMAEIDHTLDEEEASYS